MTPYANSVVVFVMLCVTYLFQVVNYEQAHGQQEAPQGSAVDDSGLA